jgi:hypothetical protein
VAILIWMSRAADQVFRDWETTAGRHQQPARVVAAALALRGLTAPAQLAALVVLAPQTASRVHRLLAVAAVEAKVLAREVLAVLVVVGQVLLVEALREYLVTQIQAAEQGAAASVTPLLEAAVVLSSFE